MTTVFIPLIAVYACSAYVCWNDTRGKSILGKMAWVALILSAIALSFFALSFLRLI